MVFVKGQSGNPNGGPPGNQHAKKHGVRGLQIARRVGKIDKRTSFGQAFERRRREYVAHLGGDQLSAMEQAIIEDTVWTDFYVTVYDVYLAGLNSVIRKGRPHPIVDASTKLAARRENLKTLGLKRVAKTLSLSEILAKDNDTPANDATNEVPLAGLSSNRPVSPFLGERT